ncbi:MAG: transporter substrate-binding domain-containing protein [Candidatus Aenigmarchaeota archaeon]|nr:transporter substrate-binding domain-containing protein [Candidatus Aenigmarchaeota archaeon]
MKKSSVAVLVALAFLVGVASSTLAAESIYDLVKKKGSINVGLGTDVPPLSLIDPKDGIRKGFDIDIAYAIVKRVSEIMEKELKLKEVTVNNKTRIAFLANRRVDLTIRSMSHTRSRDEQIDYAEPPYLWSGKIFYAKKGRFKNPIDICGKRMAVVQGSNAYLAGQDYLKELGCKKEFKLFSFQNNAECFLALKQGKVDAYIQDTPIIAGVAGAEGVDYEPVGPIFSPGLYGIGVPPNDSRWRDTISFALQDLITNGTYEKIYQKWFGPDGIAPLPINARPRLPEDLFGDRNQFVWPR